MTAGLVGNCHCRQIRYVEPVFKKCIQEMPLLDCDYGYM
jgi:hypothetical protein